MVLSNIQTARLRLEPLTVLHSERLFKLHQDETLYELMPRNPPETPEKHLETVTFLEKRLSPDEKEYWFNWVGIEKDTGAVVCTVQATFIRDTRSAFLAYFTFPAFQKKGFAKESCSAVVKHLFEEWNASGIVIEMDARNKASIRLAESLGAIQTEFKPAFEFFKGAWSDEYKYEIHKDRATPIIRQS